jgi:hypothetical protein
VNLNTSSHLFLLGFATTPSPHLDSLFVSFIFLL